MFKYLITQEVFILVGEARPSMDGLDPPLAPNRAKLITVCELKTHFVNVSLTKFVQTIVESSWFALCASR